MASPIHVCFREQTRHCKFAESCLLMTQSGHEWLRIAAVQPPAKQISAVTFKIGVWQVARLPRQSTRRSLTDQGSLLIISVPSAMSLAKLASALMRRGAGSPPCSLQCHPGIEASSNADIRMIVTAAKATSASSILRMLTSQLKLFPTERLSSPQGMH